MKQISRYLLTLVALFAMTAGAWADDLSESFTTNTSASVYTGEHFKITPDYPCDEDGFALGPSNYATIEALNGEIITKVELTKGNYNITSLHCEVGTVTFSGDVATVSGVNNTSLTFNSDPALQIKAVKVYFITAPAEPPIEVTTNAASEGATFTEASFTMPDFDATVSYELVRDMAQSMTTQVGDGNDGFTIRVKKDGESFVPSEMTLQQMMALYTVHDDIENQDLVFYGDGKVCDISIFAVDDQDQPTGDAIAFTALTPGRYVAIATAAEGSAYDGQTPASNIFELAEAYDLTLSPATNANLKSVTVGDETATPDENGVIKNIEPAKKVKITTTGPDYIIRKATVTKTVNMLYIEASNHKLYYMEGETWRQAIDNHTDLNQGWQYGGMEVWFGNIVNVLKGNGAAVDPGSVIDPTKTYTL